ncbi:DUF11 domain-containing protein [Pseudoxanthomonas wuyuanensis]|uniref:Conserved repeat domain-containing protein n=1 Tax=Pseudoxanthomonas wuyuanensis TaxID=1073196 RepID=A0A286D625_9GAMM|nr:DUF11 domain-containing protein [Pseudoxanthomonas wuyuanensis]SOD54054.1 conserved repeat domain-containing protein [Pseudoxanthomonas wuyuanensis]
MKNNSSHPKWLAKMAPEDGGPHHRAKALHRLVSIAIFLAFSASALWTGNAQAQIVLRETFGSANATLPTALSTADGNWTSAACLNGQIVATGGDSASDGAGSTHYLFHNTATCAYTAGQAVWRTVSAIDVQPNTSYVFSYWTMVANQVSNPTLSQVVTPNAGTVTVVSTTNPAYPATNNSWIRRMVVFTTSATTTAVNLRINNANTASAGNDFGIDDVVLATMPTITLTKTTQNGTGGPFTFALTNTRQASGTVTTTAAGTPTVVDGDANAAVTDFTVSALGTAVTINESTLPALWNFASASCTNSSGAAVGTLSGRQITIPAGAVAMGERFTCSYVNSTPPSFGSCTSDMFLAQNSPTQVFRADTSSNPFTYPAIGPASSLTYNAVGYDPASNYLYGTYWDTAAGNYRLLRIASNGAVQDLGAISGGGINVDGAGIASGEIGTDGYYYVKRNPATTQMWRVNLSTRAATLITLSQAIASADLAWHNGLLYAHAQDTGLLHSINPTTGAVTTVGAAGVVTGSFGSMFGASNGVFGSRNEGGFYQFNLTTGVATLISDSPPSGNNDGAKCATSPLDLPADLAITKTDNSSTYTPGNNVVYTIEVSNNGPFGAQNVQVVDALPTGITTASWTCATTSSGGVCGAASGSGAINTTANLPAGASVTYTLTLFVPSTFSGNLVNTATVTAPAGTIDPDTSNNSASDTDSQFPLPEPNVANLSCSSDASLLNTAYDGNGGRLTSGVDAHWQVALTTTPITGAPPGGLSYNAATVVTNPPANYMVSPYNNASWISHAADAVHPTNVNYDIFYRYQLNLGPGTDPAVLAPRLDFYSDNSVIEIWINGVAQNIQSNYGAADPYFYAGFTAANPAAGTLVGPWLSGFNEIVVHVKSGPGAQAFLAQVVLPQSVCQPATVTLNKTTRLIAGGPFGFGLTNTEQASGSVSTTVVDTPTQVDGDSSSAGTAEPFAVTTFGTDVVITENTLPAGWLLTDATCTSGGTPVGSRSGSAYTIPGGLIDASAESFECTFTNTPTTSLRIDKTVSPTTARAGDTVTYAITVNNDGPGPGDGAVMADPEVPGVDCTAATLSCSASGGAACPVAVDVATLQDAGLTIPTFPAGGSLQFEMSCTVTATGQ